MKKSIDFPQDVLILFQKKMQEDGAMIFSHHVVKIVRDYSSGKLVAPSSISTARPSSPVKPKLPYWKNMSKEEFNSIYWHDDPEFPKDPLAGIVGDARWARLKEEPDLMSDYNAETRRYIAAKRLEYVKGAKLCWKGITEEEFDQIDWSLDEDLPVDLDRQRNYIQQKRLDNIPGYKARQEEKWKKINEESDRRRAIEMANIVDDRPYGEKYTQEEKWAQEEKTARLHGDEAITACDQEWKDFYEERWEATQGRYRPFATKETNYL